jgi:plasmid segregation protein ParM
MHETLGVDGGNSEVKLFGRKGSMKFLSILGEFRERKLEQRFGEDDMIFEYGDRKGFAGTLAKHECEYGGSMPGDSKAHEDLLIRVLLALHRYSNNAEFKIVVGQPIGQHTKNEKQKIKDMLLGEHVITVNDIEKTINIIEVQVAAEGGAAFWSNPKDGLVRILDIGSATVNAATLDNARYIDKDSFSLKIGMNTTVSKDSDALARYIATNCLKKWDPDDNVYLVGGAAYKMFEPLSNYFFNLDVLKPKMEFNNTTKEYEPIFANAVGFYKIGRRLYDGEGKNQG